MSLSLSLVTGVLGGACTTAALYPQVFKAAKSRSTRDVPWVMIGLMIAGSAIWALHGLAVGSVPMVAWNAAALVGQSALAAAKAVLERNDSRGAKRVVECRVCGAVESR
jgi:MtN3 and saliva related transmembrane protein